MWRQPVDKRSNNVKHFFSSPTDGVPNVQVYIPCSMTVSVSWLSFWLDHKAVRYLDIYLSYLHIST